MRRLRLVFLPNCGISQSGAIPKKVMLCFVVSGQRRDVPTEDVGINSVRGVTQRYHPYPPRFSVYPDVSDRGGLSVSAIETTR